MYLSSYNFNLNPMRRERKGKESEQDEKLQSRMQLKNKLNFVSDSFSISRLTQSLGDHQKISNMFPHINEPTIEFKETEQSNQMKLQSDDSLQHYESEGLTARLSYQQRTGNQLFVLEDKIQSLMKEVDQKNSQIASIKKKNENLLRDLQRTKKDVARKNQIIQSQQKEITTLKLKQSTSAYQSRTSYSNSKSLIQQSLNNFCPQLLSPQQTVQLLNQLLKKVSKSSKMMRSLASDVGTKQILSKINKN